MLLEIVRRGCAPTIFLPARSRARVAPSAFPFTEQTLLHLSSRSPDLFSKSHSRQRKSSTTHGLLNLDSLSDGRGGESGESGDGDGELHL